MAGQGKPLDRRTIELVEQLRRAGVSWREILRAAGISTRTLHRIVNGTHPSAQNTPIPQLSKAR